MYVCMYVCIMCARSLQCMYGNQSAHTYTSVHSVLLAKHHRVIFFVTVVIIGRYCLCA